MIAIFKCGKCGQDTQLYPHGTNVTETIKVHQPVPVKKVVDNKVVDSVEMHEFERIVPKTYTVRKQNLFHGGIETIQHPLMDYKGVKKTVHLHLQMGNEEITKALCPDCYQKIKPLAEKLWHELEKLKSF